MSIGHALNVTSIVTLRGKTISGVVCFSFTWYPPWGIYFLSLDLFSLSLTFYTDECQAKKRLVFFYTFSMTFLNFYLQIFFLFH